jgi:rhamnosyltransferase
MPLNSEGNGNNPPAIDIAAVVVWYNPTEQFVSNILTYQPYCKKIYIIDNSETQDNSQLAKRVPQSQYLWNHGNLGIAKALNQGCQQAMDDGFKWVMTMDQDSSWDANHIQEFLKRVRANRDSCIVSFAPTIDETQAATSTLGKMKRILFQMNKSNVATSLFVDRVITSGNIISLDVWESIGRFYEPLFIDEVDYEFCYRLRNKGYHIVRYSETCIHQTLVKPIRKFFPSPNYHGVRCYYISRNMLFVCENFPKYAKEFHYRSFLNKLWFYNLLNGKIENLKFLHRGRKAFLLKQMGKYRF